MIKQTIKKQLVLVWILFMHVAGFSQSGGKAIIVFEGERHNYSKTYRGKLRSDDLYKLYDYLKQIDRNRLEKEENPPTNAHDDHYRALMKKDKRQNSKKQKKFLSEQYKINERQLKKKNLLSIRKYNKEKQRIYEEGLRPTKYESKERKPVRQGLFKKKNKLKQNPYLSRYYKVRGNRLRKGEKLRYKAGNILVLIKYEIRSAEAVKTYLDFVEHYVEEGAFYKLKYHGSDGRREYYLEKTFQ